eukprot:11212647-Lingulodinium_polyedra.AAC.1
MEKTPLPCMRERVDIPENWRWQSFESSEAPTRRNVSCSGMSRPRNVADNEINRATDLSVNVKHDPL